MTLHERIDIEADLNDSYNCLLVRANNSPQSTPFKELIGQRIFVHYRKWTKFAHSEKKTH
jgi:hypothetical protein